MRRGYRYLKRRWGGRVWFATKRPLLPLTATFSMRSLADRAVGERARSFDAGDDIEHAVARGARQQQNIFTGNGVGLHCDRGDRRALGEPRPADHTSELQ